MDGRTLSAGYDAAVDQQATRAGYYVELGFDPVLRLCSRDTTPWDGHNWVARSINISIKSEKGGAKSGYCVIADPDKSLAALCLGQKARGRSIRIWTFDGSSPDEPLLYFDGVMGAVPAFLPQVRIEISNEGYRSRLIPGGRITQAIFPQLMAAGEVIKRA